MMRPYLKDLGNQNNNIKNQDTNEDEIEDLETRKRN
jgi:hypothetical protein